MAHKRKSSAHAKKPAARKKTAKHNSGTFFVEVLFFLSVFAYLVYYVFIFVNKPSIPTMTVQQGSIDEPAITPAIIIREETVYRSTAAGALNYHVKDLDRVKKGTAVCSIRDEVALAQLEKDAAQVDKSLMELQARRSDISEAQKEADKINLRIKDLVDRSIYRYVTSDIYSLYALKAAVEENVQVRNQILLSESKGSLKSYADERNQYMEEMSQHVTRMYAEETGILVESLDGLESAISFSNKEALTKEQTVMNVEAPVGKKEVVAGEAAFKIITANEWYIGAYIANDSILDYEEGDIRRIFVEQGDIYTPIEAQVSLIDKKEDESYVLFKITKNMLDFANKRSILIKTTDSVYTGYKIPNSAIVDRTLLKIPQTYAVIGDEESYVLIKDGDLVEKVGIVVKDNDDEHVYVMQDFNNIKIGDILAMPGDGGETYQISEIASVKGVYLVNSGIAEFRKLNLESNISENTGYSILDPTINKSIRSYDRIVTDAKSIHDGQVIY